MKYLPFWDFNLSHTYYSDGRCPDFRIEPKADTVRLIRNHRFVLRPSPNGVRVLVSVGGDGEPFIPISEDALFAFRLYLRNPDFTLFTELSEHATVAAPLYTNAGLGAADIVQLAHASSQAVTSETFAVQSPSEAEPFTLGGYPSLGVQPPDMAVEGLVGTASVSSYDADGKIITVDSRGASKDSGFTVTYETAPELGWGVFADIEIYNNDSLPDIPDGPGKFELAFTTKKARWNYYVVTDKADSEFNIEDRDDSPLVFSNENRRDLSREPDDSDDVANVLADQYPDMRRIRFISDEPVAYSQQSRKSIHLKMNGDSVGGVLPNPSPRNYSTVEVARNGELRKEDSLFRIVKFLIN